MAQAPSTPFAPVWAGLFALLVVAGTPSGTDASLHQGTASPEGPVPEGQAPKNTERNRENHLADPILQVDTVRLPAGWPAAFPEVPPGARLGGHTEIDRDRVPGVPGEGPYYIVIVILEGDWRGAFEHYRSALAEAGWEVLEGGTDDGSRGGSPAIAFRGHGYVGDVRFDRPDAFSLAAIHLYRESRR